MLASGVFIDQPVKEVNYKITAIDYYKDVLFVGESNGNIFRYPLNPNEREIVEISSEGDFKQQRISKQKIQQIKCLEHINSMIVLADNMLFHVNCDDLSVKETISKNCIYFCMNEDTSQFGELLVVTKKKDGQKFKFNSNPQSNKFELQPSQCQFADIPIFAAWVKKSILVAYQRKEYSLIDSDSFNFQPLPIPMATIPFIKVTDIDEFLVITSNNVGIYIGSDGQIKLKNNIALKPSQILQITIYGPYLVALFESCIQVFSQQDSKLLQEIKLQNTGKCMSSENKGEQSSYLFYCLNSEIKFLKQIPYDQQIQKCLLQCKIDDAFTIFNQNVTRFDNQRLQKLEQLKVDASWPLIKNLQFKQAKDNLIETNFDPREILVLFPEYIPASKKLVQNAKKCQTMGMLIQETLSEKLSQKREKLNEQLAIYQKQSKEFLMDLFEQRRIFYIKVYENLKDQITFISSKNNINQITFDATIPMELLEIIDYVLIKIYVEFNDEKKLNAFFTNNKVYCQSMISELDVLLQQYNKDKNGYVLAKFYENFGRIKDCLELWRQIGRSTDNDIGYDCCEQIVRILRDSKDKKLIFEYLKPVIVRNKEIAIKLFHSIPENIIGPDSMIQFFSKEFDQLNTQFLKEKYLEIVVLQNKIEDERFHTMLALFYVEKLFQFRTKESGIDFSKENEQTMTKIKAYQKKLIDYLKDPQSKYRAHSILDKIKDSWLINEEIYLYGKEKQHNLALKKLVAQNEYLMAEEYCADKTENLLTKLFEIYVTLYKDISESLKHSPQDVKRQNYYKSIKKTMHEFLKKYATHSQLDCLVVMDLIPDDWILADESEDNGVYTYLKSVISYNLHQMRNLKCAKAMSEMDLLNVECNLAKAKKANIKITSDKNCCVCHRKIGDKVFGVFPNGVTAHQICISNKGLSICPLTGQNFEKTFKI